MKPLSARIPALKSLSARLGELVARRRALVALGAYALVVVWFTWPVLPNVGASPVGRVGDQSIALWDNWWLAKAFSTHASPFYTRHLFYPTGVSLVYHSISWLTALVALPLRALFGAVASYNLTFLLETLLCAGSMFALALYLTKDALAAWISGFVFAFDPYRITRAMQHPNLANTGFIPLVFLGLFRAWRDKPRAVWLAAAALACVLLTGVHLFLMTSVALLVLVPFEAWQTRRFRDVRFWKTTLYFGLACLVLVGPLVVPYVQSRSALGEAMATVTEDWSTDLLALIVPAPHHAFGAHHGYRLYGEAGSVAYLGVVALLLAAAVWLMPETRRAGLVWWTGFALLVVLSLGPRLTFDARDHDVWMPYRLVERIPIFRAVRAPERLNLLARVFFAVAVAWGVVALARLLPKRSLAGLVALPLVLFDYYDGPYPMRPIDQSQFYNDLAQRGGTGAILPLPLDRQSSKRAMLAQTIHGRPILGGMVARTPNTAHRYIHGSSLLRALAANRPLDCRKVTLRDDLARLKHDNVEFIVVRYPHVNGGLTSAYRSYLVDQPYFADRHLEAHRIDDLLAARLPCDAPE
ncbi:MAG TPA: hypothetical protein VLJ38_18055 [Polyangiaceae bacterium]|nr:hypothetical protein [Polyangiaceae bacterium]